MTLPLVRRDLLVRLVLLVALDQGLRVLVSHSSTTEDADIGSGLMALAAIVLVAVLGGLVDGLRRSFPHVAVVWTATSLLYGVATCVALNLGHGPVDWSGLAFDLTNLAPVTASIVAFPSVLAGGVVALGAPTHVEPADATDKAGKP